MENLQKELMQKKTCLKELIIFLISILLCIKNFVPLFFKKY